MLRVAYTLEQCWHDVPGGTAVAALEIADRLHAHADVDLIAIAGRHRRPPVEPYRPSVPVRTLPIGRPLLYETWNRWSWPTIESATGEIDVCHSTTAIPAATRSPHVVTVHDIAFVHTPERFTRRGARVMTTGLDRCRAADVVTVPSAATRNDLVAHGFDAAAIHVVPWGVSPDRATDDDVARVRGAHELPDRFVLFVGTLEPRKNLERLLTAIGRTIVGLPLVIAGPVGWGDLPDPPASTRVLGFVPADDLAGLYAAATVVAYPSLQEGFGMPVAEAMAQGAPVVTSRGTSTEDVAGGAAVLVDPTDTDSIARGIDRAVAEAEALGDAGLARAAELSWDATADATVAAYRAAIERHEGGR